MITYVTKSQNGKTAHFRTVVNDNILEVVEGEFYYWLSEWGTNCSTNLNALQEAQTLIDKKLSEGYSITRFTRTKENSYNVYDKGKYHYGGNFPAELDEFQGLIHTGMYIGWLIDKNLLSTELSEELKDPINEFKSRQTTGAEFFQQYLDETLLIEQLNEEGNRFSLEYFDFDTGGYLTDYENTLAKTLPSLYHVEDSWNNFNKISIVIDDRYVKWKLKQIKKPWWQLWK